MFLTRAGYFGTRVMNMRCFTRGIHVFDKRDCDICLTIPPHVVRTRGSLKKSCVLTVMLNA